MEVLVTIPQLKGEKKVLKEIRNVSPELNVKYTPCHSAKEVKENLDEDVEVLYTRWVPADLSVSPNLKWIQYHSAGVENLVKLDSLKNRDILVTNVSGAHAVPIAEYVLGTIIMLARGFIQLVQDKDYKVWDRSHGPEKELRGKTLGITGYGSIGREIARLASCFEMRILACKRTPEKKRGTGFQWPGIGDPGGTLPDRIYPPSQLRQMLPQCDFLVSAVPHTSETAGMLGESEFRTMKPSAYFVNVSRGAVCDESALIRALKEKWIAGAALDTFNNEPLSSNSKFWNTGDSVFISPHISGTARNKKYNRRTTDIFVENLRRYVNGEKLLNVINLKLGY